MILIKLFDVVPILKKYPTQLIQGRVQRGGLQLRCVHQQGGVRVLLRRVFPLEEPEYGR